MISRYFLASLTVTLVLVGCRSTVSYELTEAGLKSADALCAERVFVGKPERRFLDMPMDKESVTRLEKAIKRHVPDVRIAPTVEEAQIVVTFTSSPRVITTHAEPGPDELWVAMFASAKPSCEVSSCGTFIINGENRTGFSAARSFADTWNELRRESCVEARALPLQPNSALHRTPTASSFRGSYTSARAVGAGER